MGLVSSKGNSISPNSKRQTGPKHILWCLLANQRACWPGGSLPSAGSTFLKFSSLTENSPTSRALSSPRSPVSYNPAVSAERSWLHLFCTAPDSLMTRSCLLFFFSQLWALPESSSCSLIFMIKMVTLTIQNSHVLSSYRTHTFSCLGNTSSSEVMFAIDWV